MRKEGKRDKALETNDEMEKAQKLAEKVAIRFGCSMPLMECYACRRRVAEILNLTLIHSRSEINNAEILMRFLNE